MRKRTTSNKGTSATTRRSVGSSTRASVITVDATRSGVEGNTTIAGSNEVSGSLGRSNEGGGSLRGSYEGGWASSRSYKAGRSSTRSTNGLGALLGSYEVRWAGLGSNVGLGSLSGSNVRPATNYSCGKSERLNIVVSRNNSKRKDFVKRSYAPPDTIC